MSAGLQWLSFCSIWLAVLVAAYWGVCGVVAHRFTTARRRGAGGAESGALRGHQVHFPARDQRARIAAWYLPAESARGAVVFVHGRNSCRGDALKGQTVDLARRLNARGLSVLMIDLRGHGQSTRGRLTYGWRERDDVLGAVDYLLERGYEGGTIGLLGASMGGVAALGAAAADDAIGAVVAASPYADFGAMIDRCFTSMCGLPRLFVPGALLAGRLLTGIDLRHVRALDHARQLRGRPLVIIHARHDPLVPVADARALAIAGDATLWLTECRVHIGSFASDPAGYGARVAEFFCGHLRPHCATVAATASATAPQLDGAVGADELALA